MSPAAMTIPATTSQSNVAGVASAFPAASTARTANVCGPSETPVSSAGVTQDANAAPSSLHSNVAAGSGEDSARIALVEVVVLRGPASTAVSGAAVSTVHACAAGVGSVFPAASVA